MSNKEREPLLLQWDFHNNWGPMLSRAGDLSALYQKAVVSTSTSWTAQGAVSHGTAAGGSGTLSSRVAPGIKHVSSSSLSPATHSGGALPMIHVVGVNTLQLTSKLNGFSTTVAQTNGTEKGHGVNATHTGSLSVSNSSSHTMSVPHGRHKQRNASDGRASYDIVSSLQKSFRSNVYSLELDSRAGNGTSKDEPLTSPGNNYNCAVTNGAIINNRLTGNGFSHSSPTRAAHRSLHTVHSSSASAAGPLHVHTAAAASLSSEQLPPVSSLLLLASPPVSGFRGPQHHWLVDGNTNLHGHTSSFNFHPADTMQKTIRLPAIQPGSRGSGDSDANNNSTNCHGNNNSSSSSGDRATPSQCADDGRTSEQHMPRQRTLHDTYPAARADNFFQLTTNNDVDSYDGGDPGLQVAGLETLHHHYRPPANYDAKAWKLPVLNRIQQSDVESVEESASDDGSVADGQENSASDGDKLPPAESLVGPDEVGDSVHHPGAQSPTSLSHRMPLPANSVVPQHAASLIDTRGYDKFARKKRSKTKASKH